MGRADALKPGHGDGRPPLARAELPIDTVALARYLIGKDLVRELPEGVASGRIVETEAYVVGDAAGHAYRGMTPRNRSLFLERGHAYVYFAYGVSYMLNVSSETPGIGAGVLIRALEPLEGIPSCGKIAASSACAIWRAGREGSPRRCGSIVRSTGSIFAEKALYGSRTVTTNPARSGRASGSAFHGMQTASCDSTSAAVHSSAVQGRSTNRRAAKPEAQRAKSLRRQSCAIVVDCPPVPLDCWGQFKFIAFYANTDFLVRTRRPMRQFPVDGSQPSKLTPPTSVAHP